MRCMLTSLLALLLVLTGCKVSETLSMSSNQIPYTDDQLARLDLADGQSIFVTDLKYESESVGTVSSSDSLSFSVIAARESKRGDDWPTTAFREYRQSGQVLPRRRMSRKDVVALTYRKVDPVRTVAAVAVFGVAVAGAAWLGLYVLATSVSWE